MRNTSIYLYFEQRSGSFRYSLSDTLGNTTFHTYLVYESIDFTSEKSLLCKGSLSKAPCGYAV